MTLECFLSHMCQALMVAIIQTGETLDQNTVILPFVSLLGTVSAHETILNGTGSIISSTASALRDRDWRHPSANPGLYRESFHVLCRLMHSLSKL